MTVSRAVAGGTGRNVTLITNGPELKAGTIEAMGDSVVLRAAVGAITDGNSGANNIKTKSLVALAASGIDLDTDVDNVTAVTSGTGAITIDEANALTLKSVSSANGLIRVNAGGPLTATSVVGRAAGSSVVLGTSAGDLGVNLIQATGGTVQLSAAGAITDLNGAANNITAANLTVLTATGIGTAADPLEVMVGALDTAGVTGPVFIIRL